MRIRIVPKKFRAKIRFVSYRFVITSDGLASPAKPLKIDDDVDK